MPAEPILEVQGLGKRFGGLVALDSVSFRVEQGSIFSVIGPNGAGKTTLFSCLVGSQRPSSGSIRFKGREVAGLRNDQVVQRGLVRTHQIVRPFRDMTVAENVAVGSLFGRRHRRGAEARSRVAAVLERAGLAGRASALARTLPIGDLKRLEIARALATEPEVLCLDEVMGGLNPVEIEGAMQLIRDIRASGVTVLMIEHHVHAVLGVSDRVMVLNFGRTIAEGAPQQALRDPAVVAAYLGDETQGATA
ncbi:MAG: ABC transporter ATP-binding protein [Myxococcaceae bacterium]